MWHAHPAREFTGGDARATSKNESGFELIEAAFFLPINNACQLEGSDHGGRDTAAELALAGTIDVHVSDSSCNRLALVSAPSDAKNYTPRSESVNEILGT